MKKGSGKQSTFLLTLLGTLIVAGGCTANNDTWHASADTIAQFYATHTAYAGTAMAQGTPQPAVTPPTLDSVFYYNRSALDTLTAPAERATNEAYHNQVLTAVAQGTPTAFFISPTIDHLARLQQTAVVETAAAQGTPAASFPTLTLVPTYSPAPVSGTSAAPASTAQPFNWSNIPILGPMIDGLRSLGGEGLINYVIGGIIALLLWNFRQLFNFGKWLFLTLQRAILKQNKDYAFEQAYLGWLIGQNRHLGLLPAQVVTLRWGDRQQFVDLEDIYVTLSLSLQSGDEEWAKSRENNESRLQKSPDIVLRIQRALVGFLILIIEDIFPAAFVRKIRDSWYGSNWTYAPGNLGLVIDKNQRLILRGNPGSGKTTIMRYLAVTTARALRNDYKDGDNPNIARKRLLWTETPFPILVRLGRHSNVSQWDPDKSLTDAFRDELPTELRRDCPPDFFERRLRTRPCLVLLDAFDELGTPATRAAMAQKINGFLGVFGRPANRIIVTTRIIGYEGQLDPQGFHIRSVQPLHDGEVRALIKQRYKAFAFSETVGKNATEANSIRQKLVLRSNALIDRVESTPRLRQLATNPMLLSLIVFVHFLKVELPDERVLLYRDCVEILTARWQQYKRVESGSGELSQGDLGLAQKLLLLQDVALAMQKQRTNDSVQALMRRAFVKQIIASKLPELISTNLPQDPSLREIEYQKRADEWIDGIQATSGILVEQGLDEDGEPLIGFSHLTFQEYLAAIALQEKQESQKLLMSNLLNPAWQEVVLLFVKVSNDASFVIQSLLDSPDQPGGALLAGRCLAEKIRTADQGIHEKVLNTLLVILSLRDDPKVMQDIETVLVDLDQPEIFPILQQNVFSSIAEIQIGAIRSIQHIRPDNPNLAELKRGLIAILDLDCPIEVKIAAREVLTRIGDDRFLEIEPVMLHVSAAPLKIETRLSSGAEPTPENRWLRFFESLRNADAWMYKMLRRLFASAYTDAFEISRYPITNLQYARFIEETGHSAPSSWIEGIYPQEKATHPVVDVSPKDTQLYCQWLSRKTAKVYVLPTEWEWEIAATGNLKSIYPWGNEFDANKCNSIEAGVNDTTPVGIYFDTKSTFGLQDTSGNAAEVVRGSPTVPILVWLTFCGMLLLLTPYYHSFGGFLALIWDLILVFAFSFLPWLMISLFFFVKPSLRKSLDSDWLLILADVKGGSWGDRSLLTTSIWRSMNVGQKNKVGFRVVRVLENKDARSH